MFLYQVSMLLKKKKLPRLVICVQPQSSQEDVSLRDNHPDDDDVLDVCRHPQHRLPEDGSRPPQARRDDPGSDRRGYRQLLCEPLSPVHGHTRTVLPADNSGVPDSDHLSAAVLRLLALHWQHHCQDQLRGNLPQRGLCAVPSRLADTAHRSEPLEEHILLQVRRLPRSGDHWSRQYSAVLLECILRFPHLQIALNQHHYATVSCLHWSPLALQVGPTICPSKKKTRQVT